MWVRLMKKLIRFIRALVSINARSLYHLILKTAAAEAPKVDVVETSEGRFSGISNDLLFQHAVSTGINEEHFVSIATALLKPGDVALDLGGNIGTHTIVLANLVPEGHVYTFEPQSLTFSILQNNVLLNSLTNVTTFRFACSDVDYDTISMEPFSYTGDVVNNGSLRVDSKSFLGDLALTRRLDSFNFPKVDFIKVDIQGSEVKALNGACDLVSSSKPYIFIEVEELHLRAMGSSAKELIEYILSFGYALYRIETDYPCDHICVPLDKTVFFEAEVLSALPFGISSPIIGSVVDLTFDSDNSQNYSAISVVK